MAVIDPLMLNEWHAIAKSQDLQEGAVLQARLLGKDLVLWRCGGQVYVWQDFCPHRGARLSLGWVEGNTLVCPYHGFAFDSNGQCVSIPAHPNQKPSARNCTRTYKAQERYGLVWTSLGEPDQQVAPFPEWDNSAYRRFFGGPYHFRTSGLRIIENFFDLSHAPFVHQGILGDPSHPMINDYKVELHSDGITFGEVFLWQPDSDGNGQGAPNNFNYHIARPLTAYFRSGPAERRFNIFFTVTPVEEEECIGWLWLVMNFGDSTEAEAQSFIERIIAQDTRIVESQRPRRLPLDLQSEVHVPSDLASISYRKWLKQLGVTFGAI